MKLLSGADSPTLKVAKLQTCVVELIFQDVLQFGLGIVNIEEDAVAWT
jgi:hypothetical protein